MTDPTAALAAGLRDRYLLERPLGRGGMATVYLARDLRHDRPVALKVLLPELAANLGLERFQREIKLAARLQHPHILTVLDSGDAADQLWFTMPYVEGQSLRDRLHREHQLPVEDALRITREAAAALDYAHEHGVVHRDVKPENILLTRRGEALVADFGIARALGSSVAEALTQTGMAVGTPAYMSPEQAAGGAVDGRSDLYSLGCVLYEMLAGEVPYTGPTAQAIVAKRFSDPVPSVRRVRPTVPEAADHAIQRVLALVPADRFGTGVEFAQALQLPVVTPTALPTVITPAPAPTPAPPATIPAASASAPIRARRHAPVGAITLGLGFVIGLGVLFAWRRSHGGAEDSAGPKRLAVLPFENQGDSADAYFADGITNELRGRLATVPGIEVIAGRSSNAYRRATKSLPEIAKDLGADYLLVGTIQWVKGQGGTGRVRVSPELIRVAPRAAPTTKWAQPFDASLTDVFQVQADIAGRVTTALNVALGPSVAGRSERPTLSAEAYDLYLRANEYNSHENRADGTIAIELYERAVGLDSNFALAWAGLSQARAYAYWSNWDPSSQQIELARQAAERAIALQPDLPEAHLAMGYYHYWGHRDYDRALAEFAIAQRVQPNNVGVIEAVGLIQRRQGKWPEALASLKRGAELDPLSYDNMIQLAETYALMRDYAAAEHVANGAIALAPDLPSAYGVRVSALLNRDGQVGPACASMRGALSHMALGKLLAEAPLRIDVLCGADPAYAGELAAMGPSAYGPDSLSYFMLKAQVYHMQGEPRARAYFDSAAAVARSSLRRRPDDALTHGELGVAEAYLGRRATAIQEGLRGTELLPTTRDAYYASRAKLKLAMVYAIVGEPDAAAEQLRAVLAAPSDFSAAGLRADPIWAPLKGNPRFERLVAGR